MPARSSAQTLEIDPDEIMEGSPFAIPPTPGQSKVALGTAVDGGDLRAFLAALALIFGLVTVIGFALLPGF